MPKWWETEPIQFECQPDCFKCCMKPGVVNFDKEDIQQAAKFLEIKTSDFRKKFLKKVFAGSQVGTLFWSGEGKIKDRKHWIAHTLKPAGSVKIDAGARKALVERGKSLLAAGVVTVDGQFEFGAAVRILDEKGNEIARGLVNYHSRDLDQIKGMKTAAVRSLVGPNFYEEVIHRDDLVLM